MFVINHVRVFSKPLFNATHGETCIHFIPARIDNRCKPSEFPLKVIELNTFAIKCGPILCEQFFCGKDIKHIQDASVY